MVFRALSQASTSVGPSVATCAPRPGTFWPSRVRCVASRGLLWAALWPREQLVDRGVLGSLHSVRGVAWAAAAPGGPHHLLSRQEAALPSSPRSRASASEAPGRQCGPETPCGARGAGLVGTCQGQGLWRQLTPRGLGPGLGQGSAWCQRWAGCRPALGTRSPPVPTGPQRRKRGEGRVRPLWCRWTPRAQGPSWR